MLGEGALASAPAWPWDTVAIPVLLTPSRTASVALRCGRADGARYVALRPHVLGLWLQLLLMPPPGSLGPMDPRSRSAVSQLLALWV